MATTSTTERETAFGELYRAHLAAVVNYAARRAVPADAVDVAAETFAIAWRRVEDIPVDAVRPWLYGVARRVLSNQRRGTLRRTALHDRLCSEWFPAAASNEPAGLSPLRTALDSLSDDDRDLLLLAGVEELKPSEIALVLEVSPEVARNRLSRARSRLRTVLQNESDETTEGERS